MPPYRTITSNEEPIIGDCERHKKAFLENRKAQKIGKKRESK
jgi:hypothetical protein